MYKQSFSQKNLRHIFDDENKKGRYLEGEFFPQVEELSKKVKNARQSLLRIRKKKSLYSQSTYEERRNRVLSIIRHRKNNQSEKINEELSEVANSISGKSFLLDIRAGAIRSNRPTFCLGNTVEDFFASKQLQRNVSLAFGVKQSSRHSIIPQIANIFQDYLPKIVIRTDISSFYESLDHKILFDLMKLENALSLSSKKMLGKLLSDYSRLSGTSGKGIPRGIGVSASLSEVYMAGIDAKLRKLEDVIYYARYVDDIILIFCPSTPAKKNDYLTLVKDAIESCSLEMNGLKTKTIDLTNPSKEEEFDFLGYKFCTGTKFKLDLSRRKIEAYQEKIDVVFEKFLNGSRSKPNEKLLVKRVRFLTGNTKLTNNKGGAFVGVYFSNRFINTCEGLVFLDKYLDSKLSELSKPSLRRRLKKLSFSDGFNASIFRKFTAKELSDITRVWR